MSNKTIYLLIGPKGSGKSFLGTILETEFGIKFIRVEDSAKRIKKDREINDQTYLEQVFTEIEREIRKSLLEWDKLVFESTGLTDHFDRMLRNLKQDFQVITIGVTAQPHTCLNRVKTRDQSIHINVSDEQVLMINQKVEEKKFHTDFKIHNESKNEKELIKDLKKIIP